MSKLTYIYQWTHEDKRDNVPFIRAYGVDQHGDTVCLRVHGFRRYVYIELPDPDQADYNVVCNKVVKEAYRRSGSSELVEAHHLFYYDKATTSPFIRASFGSLSDLNTFIMSLRSDYTIRDRYKVHEDHANPVLQLISNNNLEMTGWVSFDGKEVSKADRQTRAVWEYMVDYRYLRTADECKDKVEPYVMSFDFEVYSENEDAMPSNKPRDYIFQISCVFNRPCRSYQYQRVLLTLPSCDDIKDACVVTCENEKALLTLFLKLIRREKPNVMLGYNILGFDIPYLIQRCERYMLLVDLKLVGLSLSPAKQQEIKWSSSAFRNQHFTFIDWEGIVLMDLLPIIQRDHKLDSYKLEAVGQWFLGSGKDPVTFKDILDAYRTGSMTKVGKYCIKDSNLVLMLYDKLQTWIAYTEMAKVCNVSVFALYTQGQQYKIYSQVYRHCCKNNIVVDSRAYTAGEGEKYRGAHVIEPVPGYYEDVVPLDFSSLYPSIIQAYNICFSTAVIDPRVPDDLCTIFEWEDHQRCDHDPKVIRYKELTTKIKQIEARQKNLRALRDDIRISNASTKLDLYDDLVRRETIERYQDQIRLGREAKAKEDAYQAYKEAGVRVSNLVSLMDDLDAPYSEELVEALRHEKEAEDVYKGSHKVPVVTDVPPERELQRLMKATVRTRVSDYKTNNLQRQITLLDEECKPLREERANLKLLDKSDVMCAKRRYRFYKQEVQRGVIPIIISNLLQSRKDIRRRIADLEAKPDQDDQDRFLIMVYTKQQLAMKVAANSMYGGMGMSSGLLAYMPAAMCVTMKGREALQRASSLLQDQYKAHLVYGDTDSTYVRFPWISDATQLWDHAIKVASEISGHYPSPMKLEFEMAIYRRFLILSKKRYMWQACGRDGTLNPQVGTKGVLLSRRDNSGYLKTVYHDVTELIFNKASKADIVEYLLTQINNLYRGQVPVDQFVITKSIGDFQTEFSKDTSTLGSYKVNELPSNSEDRKAKLKGRSEREYYIQSCPAHVRLAERMRLRGHPVEANSRIQFVVLDRMAAKTLGDRVEDFDYYLEHRRHLKIYYLYYLSSLSKPLNQLLKVGLGEDNFLDKEERYRTQYTKVVNEIIRLNRPTITVV